MANIVGLAAMSHSPSWDLSRDLSGPGRDFVAAIERMRRFNGTAIDAMVIFGPDHYRNFFYDVLPQFCVGIEKVEAYGDYDSPEGPLPCASVLGREILNSVMQAGFDPAVSLNMCIDHGHSQVYAALDPEMVTPIVPIMINCQGGPRPTYGRVAAFGAAVGAAIRGVESNANVLVVGSGGLSHFLPKMSADDPDTPAETREYIINGRTRSREVNAQKEVLSRERRQEKRQGRINQEWDHWFLRLMESGDFSELERLGDAEIEEAAGNGAHELRSWIAAAAAWGSEVVTVGYEPVPTWITGMGVIGGGVGIPSA